MKITCKYAKTPQLVSLIHSVISGFGSVIALCDSKIWKDLINYYSVTGSHVIQFSTGYFIFDLFAILENSNFDPRKTWELVVHHLAVLSCIGISGFFDYYHGFSSIALLMEINTIFLHSRTLLKFRRKCDSLTYKIVAIVNLTTIVCFRIAVAGLMLYLFDQFKEEQAQWEYYICNFGVSVVGLMSLFLFYRCLKFDRIYILNYD